MKLRILAKENKKVEITLIPDSEGDKNRGWQVDKFEAFIPGNKEPVGYLKCAYIPLSRFNFHYPDVWAFIDKIQGSAIRGLKDKWEYFANGDMLAWGDYCKQSGKSDEEKEQDVERWMKESEKFKRKIKEFNGFKPITWTDRWWTILG